MEEYLIKKFKHRIGTHCISTALMNILNNYGIGMSEELVVGIGSGLGFTYIRGKRVCDFLVFGRSDDLEMNFAQNFNLKCIAHQHSDSKLAWEKAKILIQKNIPILVDVDASRLKYIRDNLNWPLTASHGGHKIIVVGYKAGEILFYDYSWQELKRLSLEEFFYSWQTSGVFTPYNNFFYEISIPEIVPSISFCIKKGIMLNVLRMKGPFGKYHGLQGLRSFIREVPYWGYLVGDQEKMKLANATYIALEIGGTGKGAFRRMYSRFLKEAAKILGEEELIILAEEYLVLSRKWSEYLELIRIGSCAPKEGIFSGNICIELLGQEIIQGENALIKKMESKVEKWVKGVR